MRSRIPTRVTLPTPTVALPASSSPPTLRWASTRSKDPQTEQRFPEGRKSLVRKTLTPGPEGRTIDDEKLFKLNFDFEGEQAMTATKRTKSSFRPVTPPHPKVPLQWGNTDLKATSHLTKRPIYSVKYFGVTDGDFGVLTRKRLMPVISPLEACTNTPLAVLTTVDRHRTAKIIKEANRGKSESPSPIPLDRRAVHPDKDLGKTTPDLSETSEFLIPEEYLKPTPAKYDQHLVHTYARPRGLVRAEAADTIGKCSPFYLSSERCPQEMKEYMTRYETAKKKVYQVTLQRRDIRGWKLTQPKTGLGTRRMTLREEDGTSVFKPPSII